MIAAGLCDDSLGDLALEHQCQRRPPRAPFSAEPAKQQSRPDIVRKVGDNVRTAAHLRVLIDIERIPRNHTKIAGKFRFKLGKGGEAAAVALNGNQRSTSLKNCPGQAAGTGSDLINLCIVKRSWNGSNPCQQVPIEDEVLTQGLGRLQPVACNDVAERLDHRSGGAITGAVGGHVNSGRHRSGIGAVLSGDVEGSAVVWSGSNDGETQRDIDAFLEMQGLQRD